MTPFANPTFNNLQDIVECVTDGSSIQQALAAFAQIIAKRGWRILIVIGGRHTKKNVPKILYCDLPRKLETASLKLLTGPGFCGGAFEPVLLEKPDKETGEPHDPVMRSYLDEIYKLGHRHIVFIPGVTGHISIRFLVAFGNDSYDSASASELALQISHFTAACTGRFSKASNRAESTVSEIASADLSGNFTARELECLLWCANGKSSYEIARILTLSEHTVNRYLGAVCVKLDAANRPHAVSKAIKLGLISPALIA